MDRARVAELIVTGPTGQRRRGSGYRVTRDAVLTAAHVVEDAVSVEVRFEPDLPGQWTTTAASWWADPRSDVALLLISPPTEAEAVPVAEFGRLGVGPAVLDVQSVGFPRWKLRVGPGSTAGEYERYRDACHAVGSVATLSNWREGTLEVALAFSPAADPGSSPWEGMSGAALWAGNRVVGVISKHHPGDGPSTLAAVRLDRALEVADPPVQQALRDLAGLPAQAVQLPCVVPAVTGVVSAATGHEVVEPVEVCPYPTDMAAFRPEQAEWFFGREALTSELVARLDHSLLQGRGPLIVVAPSGAGKSSLLQAGLVPKLDEAVLPGSRSWPRVLLTPSQQPMTAITTTLAALISDEPTTVATQLTEDPDRFVERLHRVLHARGDAADPMRPRLMLIVDQLEELFTLCADKRERQRFLELISRLTATTPSGHEPVALVVYGLRADFYARCADHPQLRTALQDNQLVLGPMSQDGLRDAICKPAEHAGLDIETNLVEVMLRDLGAGPHAETDSDGGYEAGRLPLLAHALRATWRERHSNTLTLAGYQTTGGIQKAVETTADGVYAKLSEAEQHTARTLFLRLVKLGGDDADDTRRRVPRAELLHDTTDVQRTHAVLDTFTQARLLTQYQDTVEITHEALLRAWPTLRRWIDTGRAAHLVRQDLDDAAQVWNRHGRSTAALFRGSRLREAREGINEVDLSPLGIEFLEASVQHEKDLARRRRRVMVGGWGLAALVGVLAVVLGVLFGVTKEERDNARFSQLTSQANQLRDEDPSLAAQFDLAAHRMRPEDPDVNMKLLSTQHTPLTNPLPEVGAVSAVAASADGNILATTSEMDGSGGDGVRLWDVSDPTRPPQLRGQFLPDGQPVHSVALSADGQTLATTNLIGEVRLWDVSGPAQPRSRGEPLVAGYAVGSVALSADGSTLATGGSDGEGVRLWDVSDPATPPQERGEPLPGNHEVYSVALSADGRTLATSGSDGEGVRLWDVSDPTRPPQDRGQSLPDGQDVGSLALSADGSTLATGGSDGEGVRLWDVSDPATPPQERGEPLPDSADVGSLALSADGRTLATTSTSGEVRLWNIPARSRIGDDASSVALSADGSTLATGGSDGEGVRLWDVSDPATPPQERGEPLPDSADVGSLALSTDGRTLATRSISGGVRFWDVSDPARPPKERGSLPDSREVQEVALSDDGNTVATTGGGSGEVQLWDVSDSARPPKERDSLPDSRGMYSVALSADGSTLATSGSDGEGVRLWDVSDPDQPVRDRGRSLPDSEDVESVALSVAGHTLATSGDGEVRFWDVSDPDQPQLRDQPLPDSEDVESVALSADGRTLVTNGDELRIWNRQHAIHRICATTTNNLGPAEWNQYLPNQPFDPPCKNP